MNGKHACRIDHAFVSGHFQVIGSRFVVELDGQRFVGNGRDALSDHAILVIEIERRAAGNSTHATGPADCAPS
jgi:hypothetical protein